MSTLCLLASRIAALVRARALCHRHKGEAASGSLGSRSATGDGAGRKINRELESQQQPNNKAREKSSASKLASRQEAKCQFYWCIGACAPLPPVIRALYQSVPIIISTCAQFIHFALLQKKQWSGVGLKDSVDLTAGVHSSSSLH
jgi:hypothetical protein